MSGNGNYGTLTNGPSFSNNAMVFDGGFMKYFAGTIYVARYYKRSLLQNFNALRGRYGI